MIKTNKIASSANIVKQSVILGDVSIGEDSTILFHAVLRGDCAEIKVGKCSNIQDNCTVHTDKGCPAVLGDYVTVGHNAVVHGCTVGTGSLILNRARIGKECLIGAGSVVLEDTVIPDGSLAVGNPAKVKRQLTEEERRKLYDNSLHYMVTGRKLKKEGYCV